jgi:hypothetical protein
MVGLQVVVNDTKGNALPDIPVKVLVRPVGSLSSYYIYGITDATGNAIFSNVQAYSQFTATANYPTSSDYQPNYTTATGSSNTTLFSGGYIKIVLESVTGAVNGKCPSCYTLMPNGKCQKLTSPNTLLNFSIFDILIVVAIIVVFIIVIAKVRGRI